MWVLERLYRFSRDQIAEAVQELMISQSLNFENYDDVAQAIDGYARGGIEFADHMILAAARGAGATPLVTFDRKLSREAGTLLLTVHPEDPT